MSRAPTSSTHVARFCPSTSRDREGHGRRLGLSSDFCPSPPGMAEMELRVQEADVQPLPSPRSTAASASPRELKAGRRLPIPSSGEMCQTPDGRPHLPQPLRHNTRRSTTSGLPGQEDEEGDVGEASADEAFLPMPKRSRESKELGAESLALGDEVRRQLWLAGPLVVGSLMQNLIQTISVMFVGHLGELPLAGASMATSFATVTGFSLLTGMSNALDTLCGQAFGAMLLLTVVSIPVAVVWFYAGQIMPLFGQDPDIAMEAGTYARWMIPGLFGYGLLQCHVRFLQSQNIMLPVMASAGTAALFHLVVCWLLVHVAGMGSKGAALSTAVSYSYWVYVILLAVYVRATSSCKQRWTGFSMEAFHGSLEWWSFEIIVLLSGLLPSPNLETSVMSITPWAARLAVHVVMFLAISEGIVMAMVVVRVRYLWAHAYSSEEEVVAYVARMLLLILVANFFDGIQCVLSGVARGCGWQKMCALINLGAFYVVGVRAAYLIAFVLRVGGMGLWMRIICGVLMQVLMLMIITLRTDWHKEATKAKNRVFSSSVPRDRSTHDTKVNKEVSCC